MTFLSWLRNLRPQRNPPMPDERVALMMVLRSGVPPDAVQGEGDGLTAGSAVRFLRASNKVQLIALQRYWLAQRELRWRRQHLVKQESAWYDVYTTNDGNKWFHIPSDWMKPSPTTDPHEEVNS